MRLRQAKKIDRNYSFRHYTEQQRRRARKRLRRIFVYLDLETTRLHFRPHGPNGVMYQHGKPPIIVEGLWDLLIFKSKLGNYSPLSNSIPRTEFS